MNDVTRAFWKGEKIWMKTWRVEEVKIAPNNVNGTSPRVTYYCENQPVISRVGNVLTFHVPGDFAMMGHAVNCVGGILMRTDWCQIPVSTARGWLYCIANVNDLRTYQIKPGLEIDVTTNKTNGKPAQVNEKRAERVLQQKYLTRNPLKTIRHNGKTYYLILDLHDPSRYLATDRRQECFVIFDDHSEITALIASATLKKMHKTFRHDDGLRDLLRNAKPVGHLFCGFIKSHDWIRERASPQLQKLLALWLLTHDVEQP